MSLVSLYQGNAALCLQMSLQAKSPEARNDWAELAVKWKKKAEGPVFDDTPLETPIMNEVSEPVITANALPWLVPPPSTAKGSYVPNPIAPKPFDGNLDDLWARIAAVSLD